MSDPRQQLALINGIIPVVTRQQQAALDEAARRSRDEERRRQEQEHWEREHREQRILRRGNILAEASQLIAAEEDIPEYHQLVWQQATLHNRGLPHRVETYLQGRETVGERVSVRLTTLSKLRYVPDSHDTRNLGAD